MIRWLISALGLIPASEAALEGELENQLRMLTTTPEERAELLKSAVIVGQCGITSDQLPEVIGKGMTSDTRVLHELGRWEHLDPRIARRVFEIYEEMR